MLGIMRRRLAIEPRDPRVVDEDIESTMAGDDRIDRLSPRIFIADIERRVGGAVTDRGCFCFAERVPDIGKHDIGAFGDERPRRRQTDPASRAGDQRDLPLQSTHVGVARGSS